MGAMMANDPNTLQVESKSKEFAFALQDFILAQIEQQQQQQPKSQPPGLMTPIGSPTNCNCEPLKLRVSELEQQLHVLQAQVTSLVKSGMGNTSMAQGVLPHGVQPPLPGSSLPLGQPHQPPLPPPQPSSQLPPGAGSAMSDRVSTLEGRQSAFQSQLAQISKVLGVPVGKHGKNSQVKTLVQTLREEIDLKVQTCKWQRLCTCVWLLLENP
jgi:hypothetical protein